MDTMDTNLKLESEVKDVDENFKNEIFKVDSISFSGKDKKICMQSQNGPCPLIAIVNIMLLQNKIEVDQDSEFFTGDQMANFVGDYLTRFDESADGIENILVHFNQLLTGLIVDVCFSSVTDFKNDSELRIFKSLGITLYHAWLMDPQSTPDYEQLTKYSYDQITAELVKETDNVFSDSTKAFLEEFVGSNQLTYHGLCQLNETMQEGELAVLFYNNHFSVIFKHTDVYSLCTDIGYSGVPGIVWQRLNSVDGDAEFVNHMFESQGVDSGLTSEEQDCEYAKFVALNDDFELARKMQDEENEREVPGTRSSSDTSSSVGETVPPVKSAVHPPTKESSCVIL